MPALHALRDTRAPTSERQRADAVWSEGHVGVRLRQILVLS